MRSWARLSICLAVIFAGWAFGATESWSRYVLQGLVAAAAVLALADSRRKVATPVDLLISVGPALLLALYITVQAVNASHYYQAIDQELVPQPHLLWLPQSVDATVSLRALSMLLAYVLLFWTVHLAFCRESHWKTFIGVLMISGFVMAAFATVQHVSGTRKMFWLRTPTHHSDFLGTFVNPDNYAAYMNLLIPVCLACGRNAERRSVRLGSHPGFLFYFMAAVMFASVVISNSRAGIAIALILVASWAVVESLRSRAGHKHGVPWLSGGVIVTGALLVLCLTGFGPTEHKLTSVQNAIQSWQHRVAAYSATHTMFQDHWLFGIGAGGFPHAFVYYQPDSLPGFWRYAHSDWIQYLAELGVAGVVLLAACFAAVLWPRVGSRKKQPAIDESAEEQRSLAAAICLSLAGVAIHACVDFPLHIPAIACLAVVYLSVWRQIRRTSAT